MKNLSILLIICLLHVRVLHGQSILDQYVYAGLTKNQNIQQQQISLEKSIYALKEAKSLFLPAVSFQTDYFLAGGGRTVDFPAGDLLNPVYNSLNQLTNGNNFPQLENQNILLNPNNFYDAKFRTILPVFNLEIEYNKRIRSEQVALQEVEVNLYKRELAKEIKTAYFNYMQTLEAVEIYNVALGLVNESKRINESLFRNDKVNRTVLLRADNEISKTEASREQAIQNSNSAKAYFNFLLNRDLQDSILVDSTLFTKTPLIEEDLKISLREELQKLFIAENIHQHLLGQANSFAVPKLSTFLDLGSQGFDWQFDNRSRYYFFGLSMQWDVFSFGKNKYKSKQAQLDLQINQSLTDYVEQQLQLQLHTAINAYKASIYSYRSANTGLNTAQKYYSDILRLYKEGQALYIELLDAQNQLVQAELQVNISLFDTHIKAVEIERANASFNLSL
ncbi:MAG: TolC family protein [Cyclobacteriaceae bacterium]